MSRELLILLLVFPGFLLSAGIFFGIMVPVVVYGRRSNRLKNTGSCDRVEKPEKDEKMIKEPEKREKIYIFDFYYLLWLGNYLRNFLKFLLEKEKEAKIYIHYLAFEGLKQLSLFHHKKFFTEEDSARDRGVCERAYVVLRHIREIAEKMPERIRIVAGPAEEKPDPEVGEVWDKPTALSLSMAKKIKEKLNAKVCFVSLNKMVRDFAAKLGLNTELEYQPEFPEGFVYLAGLMIFSAFAFLCWKAFMSEGKDVWIFAGLSVFAFICLITCSRRLGFLLALLVRHKKARKSILYPERWGITDENLILNNPFVNLLIRELSSVDYNGKVTLLANELLTETQKMLKEKSEEEIIRAIEEAERERFEEEMERIRKESEWEDQIQWMNHVSGAGYSYYH